MSTTIASDRLIRTVDPSSGEPLAVYEPDSPATLEAMDANLIGGDIGGGSVNLRQFLFRPTHHQYRTSAPGIYLCSSSTPPGGGVHGMCGANAARLALRRLKQ